MGSASIACVSGCVCEPQVLPGMWRREVSLVYMHSLSVTPHPQCQVRFEVRLMPQPRAAVLPCAWGSIVQIARGAAGSLVAQ